MVPGSGNIVNRLARRDMFQHDLQIWQAIHQGFQHPLNKDGFAVKNINRWIRDFPMDQQGHPDFCHPFQRRIHLADIAHTGI